jgi:hypothetical protein
MKQMDDQRKRASIEKKKKLREDREVERFQKAAAAARQASGA